VFHGTVGVSKRRCEYFMDECSVYVSRRRFVVRACFSHECFKEL